MLHRRLRLGGDLVASGGLRHRLYRRDGGSGAEPRRRARASPGWRLVASEIRTPAQPLGRYLLAKLEPPPDDPAFGIKLHIRSTAVPPEPDSIQTQASFLAGDLALPAAVPPSAAAAPKP